jgi:transcriptional regulator with XRE-family HTH domain
MVKMSTYSTNHHIPRRQKKMKQKLRKEIGMRVRSIRKTLGYTQDQIVSFFEIGRANYSRIEKGEIFPTPTILNTLCNEFHVSLDWLITNEGEMFLPRKQKKYGKKAIDFDESSEDISDLLFHMEKIPMIKHAILGYFLEYKYKNQHILREILKRTPLNNFEKK